jgi:hypothetical protein
MRFGMRHTRLAATFHLKNKRTNSRIIQEVSRASLKEFILNYRDFQHISRKHVLRHRQTAIVKQMMTQQNSQVMLMMDGAHWYVQISRDNEFQRRSFSMRKC